jgi:transposase
VTRRSPYMIELSAQDRAVLEQRARSYTAAHHQVVRAKIVLMAADGLENTAIAARLDTRPQVVSLWRKRFYQEGLVGLKDRQRTGRPRVFPPLAVVTVKALACELPAETGVPLSRWSAPELAVEAVARGVVESISASAVRRWLAADALKPWQYRSWIYPRDPDFATKATRALDLYAGFWDGKPRGERDFVICADEKTSIQARCRCHPTLPPGKARMMRVEHEYQRKGALAYLAAYDVHHARVLGRLEPTTGIEPFARLVAQVMTTEPYAGAERVFWVVDNGSSHRGKASIERMTKAWPTARLVHLPVHASWLDQIEIFFSILQRKVLTPNDLTDLDALTERVLAFQDRYNTTATPFDWKFTRADLDRLLERIAAHEPAPAPATTTAA